MNTPPFIHCPSGGKTTTPELEGKPGLAGRAMWHRAEPWQTAHLSARLPASWWCLYCWVFFNILVVAILAVLPASTPWNPGFHSVQQSGNCGACSQFSQPVLGPWRSSCAQTSLSCGPPSLPSGSPSSPRRRLWHLAAPSCLDLLRRPAEEHRTEKARVWTEVCVPAWGCSGRGGTLESQVSYGLLTGFPSECHGASAAGVASGQLFLVTPGVSLTCFRLLSQSSGQLWMAAVGWHHCSMLHWLPAVRLQLHTAFLQVQRHIEFQVSCTSSAAQGSSRAGSWQVWVLCVDGNAHELFAGHPCHEVVRALVLERQTSFWCFYRFM